MSAFGAKRKARKITVQDDEDDNVPTTPLNPPSEPQEPALQATFKSRKPFKQSSLRKSININDNRTSDENVAVAADTKDEAEDDEGGGAPLRVRPALGRSGSTKTKKRQSSSRLSFGPSETTGNDEDAMILGEEVFTPRKASLASAATENSAYRKGISKNLPLNRLPMRSLDTDADRPRYSKEYLSELQSSTPNTPQNVSTLRPSDGDEMALDPSELEGAMVVDTAPSAPPNTTVLTEAEIQEKKARRARIAKHGTKDTDDFISLSDHERETGDSYLTVLSRQIKPKADTRLVAEDEDLGEGFDDFVEDGGLSLGKKAEREARRKHRAEMASLITAAEGDSDDGSDDSEAERRAAYEAAQTRAGMDGLAEERDQQRKRLGGTGVAQVPPKITPLPGLSVLVEEFKAKMRRKEDELGRVKARIEELKAEREGVSKREPEVQKLLNEAGERYRALMSGPAADGEDGDREETSASTENNVTAAKSLLDQVKGVGDAPGQRGLESLGTTPVRRPQMEL